MLELAAPLAVVCHDAGAANQVLSWLEVQRPADCRMVMHGPAGALADRSTLHAPRVDRIETALQGASMLLSGSGWATDLEHAARSMARERGIFSVAALDHWVNYTERFTRNGETVWPDEFWVTNEYALREAQRCFAGATIRMQPDLYLERMVGAIGPPGSEPGVLYLLEPARSDWGRDQPGEFQALDYFMDNLSSAGIGPDTPVYLRPHPSDPSGKYDAWLQRHDNARLDSHPDLATAMTPVTWVAGCETAALTVALAARRRVLCTMPPWAPPCRLPHPGLLHLKHLVAKDT